MTFKICVISRKKFERYSNGDEKKFRWATVTGSQWELTVAFFEGIGVNEGISNGPSWGHKSRLITEY
jgi:hypothetical protein